MKIYAFEEAGAAAREVEIETPRPAGDEVLLKITHSGVCHSDVHIQQGELGRGFPCVAGHEIVGEVVAVGDAVAAVQPGDIRVVFPWIGCRSCAECRAEHEERCARPQSLGVVRHGGYADHVLVPHEDYLIDIEGLDPAWAATLACSGLTAYSAVNKAVHGDMDAEIVVIGVGGVGLMGIAVLSALGYRKVTAVDVDDDKLATAQKLGAAHVINSTKADAAAVYREHSGGGANSVVDFVGTSQTASLSVELIARHGTLVMVGLFGGELRMPVQSLPRKNLTIRGSYVGSPGELAAVVQHAKSGILPQPPVIACPLSAEGLNTALSDLAQGKVPGRIVLAP
ncbi:zinc-binding dehydrogenase [Streptomyces sp. NPDC056390]|uniref:zinc-binding dehydrogenase n=1 Tax=Streptomyces sp. NPDC056390 TaxID=3345806 RepID=UPI0035DA94F0